MPITQQPEYTSDEHHHLSFRNVSSLQEESWKQSCYYGLDICVLPDSCGEALIAPSHPPRPTPCDGFLKMGLGEVTGLTSGHEGGNLMMESVSHEEEEDSLQQAQVTATESTGFEAWLNYLKSENRDEMTISCLCIEVSTKEAVSFRKPKMTDDMCQVP